MKALIRTPDNEDQEIKLTLPEPFSLFPKGDILASFVFHINKVPVMVSLIGTNPYTTEKKRNAKDKM